MTAEQLHDAIGLLPADLLEKTDKLRQSPGKKKAPVCRYLSAAACAVVVLGGALLFRAVGQQKQAVTFSAAPAMEEALMDEAPSAEQAPKLQAAAPPMDAGAGSTADRSAAVENEALWMPPALEVCWGEQRLRVESGEEAALNTQGTQLRLSWQTPPEDVAITSVPEGQAAYMDGVLTLASGTQRCAITASWPEGSGTYLLQMQ